MKSARERQLWWALRVCDFEFPGWCAKGGSVHYCVLVLAHRGRHKCECDDYSGNGARA